MKRLSLIKNNNSNETTKTTESEIIQNDDLFKVLSEFPWVFLTINGNHDLARDAANIFDLTMKPATQNDQFHLIKKGKQNHKLKTLNLFAAAAYILTKQPSACMTLGQLNRDFHEFENKKHLKNPEEESQDYISWEGKQGIYIPAHIGYYLKQSGIPSVQGQISKFDFRAVKEEISPRSYLRMVGG